MRRIDVFASLTTLIMIWSGSSIGTGQAGHGITGVAGQTPAEREVRAAEEQMHTAYASGDVPLFARLYAEDGTFTYSSGQTVSSRQRIDDFARQAKAGAFRDLRDEIVSIAVFGDVALARCISKYTSQGGSESHLNILRVWHKRAGRWQVVAFQSTAMRPGTATP